MRFISCTAVTALLALGHSSLAIAAPGLDLASSTLVAGGPSAQSCQVSQDRRTDCGYLGVNKDECERSGCCWDPVSNGDNNVPWCFHRSSGACGGYTVVETRVEEAPAMLTAKLALKNGCRVYGPDVRELKLSVEYETDNRVHVKITDWNKQRWEVPESVFPRPSPSGQTTRDSAAYKVEVQGTTGDFQLKVVRKSDGEVLFDTAVSALIFEEQFLELSTRVPKDAHIFGLGEVIHSLRRDPSNTRQTMWARDSPTPKDQNIYGVHPFHMEMRNGKAHGAFLLNSNGMDVLLRPETLTYKVIGGVLDFYIFVGPTPAEVVQQYYQVIGHPHMIPYWVLGFHHCRYGYRNLGEVKEVTRRYREAKIPLETMWTDIDYMESFKDFTVDPANFPEKDMKEFVDDMHKRKQHYVLIIDPAIKAENGYAPYDEGVQKGLFIKNSDNSVFVGKVWPGLTAFPDFTNPETQAYWTKWIGKFLDMVPIDGLWIDMNEPANFCDGSCYPNVNEIDEDQSQLRMGYKHTSFEDDSFDPRNPLYKINNAGSQAPLQVKTVSADARHYNNTLHYDLHNLYGHTESIMTRKALLDVRPNKRPFVLSRSTFAGTGVHAGHWTGDNWSSWEHLYYSIPSMLSFQFFGIPLVGADICGFIGNVSEELCARWMQLGAFYPFSRNHNTIDAQAQEPYLWESVTVASRKALAVRYALLPYYYTLFFQSHKFGATVVRPLFFEFAADEQTVHMDRQFLVGGGLMVTPVLEQRQTSVPVYFAKGVWYDWYTQRVAAVVEGAGQWKTLPAALDHINVHIRGGHIVPTQEPAMTVAESRQNDHELIVALDAAGRATGNLFLDDGDSLPMLEKDQSYIHFDFAPKTSGGFALTATGDFGYTSRAPLDTVYFLGVKEAPTKMTLNGVTVDGSKWSFDVEHQRLIVLDLDVKIRAKFVLAWV